MMRTVGRASRAAAREPARRRYQGREEGSGSILAIGVLAAVLAVSGLVIPVSLALVVRQRVEGAADAAALAAADTASGAVPGSPCQAAQRASELNGAALKECEVAGVIATVTATGAYWGFAISAIARAGPPTPPELPKPGAVGMG